jgi:twinkle protein
LREDHEDSAFVQHIPCPSCGSSDANSLYDDGHTYCFSCGKHVAEAGEVGGKLDPPKKIEKSDFIPDLQTQALTDRKLSSVTCEKFHYQVGINSKGRPIQVAPYYNSQGQLVAQKIRTRDKKFYLIGSLKDALPFGAKAWSRTGRKITVTEGELDALAMSQAQGNKWPTVSIGCGAGPQVKKYFAAHLEYFKGFEEVVIMFDNDEVGRKAAEAAASVLGSRASIATLPLKDASDMLVAGRTEELINAMWRAKEYKPEGITTMTDQLDEALKPPEWGLSWPFETLTNLTYGMRLGELYAVGAGTGVGKTDFMTETVAHLVDHHKESIGYFALEQMPKETALRIAGKFLNRPLHLPDVPRTEDEVREAFAVADDKVYLYDSFGANDWFAIKDKMEYLFHNYGVQYFFLDHITALAASIDADERKGLDKIMESMGSFVKKIPICIVFVSHLATPDGRPHEEGGRVMIRHFRGSRAIGFWSHFMFGLERNQQAETEDERTLTTFRILKDRYTGKSVGSTFHFTYNFETGRLSECAANAESFGFDSQASAEETQI